MLPIHKPTETARQRAAIAIIGDPGAGKTMLAGTAPHPFFLDVEGRASHAGAPYVVPTQSGRGFDEIAKTIEALGKAKLNEDGTITWQGQKIGTVILDTVDHLQALCKLTHSNVYNKQRMYGLLLDDMMNKIIWPLMGLPVNIVLVMHTKQYNENQGDEKEKSSNPGCPRVDLALEGDLRNRLLRFFDNVLHIVVAQTGERKIVTSPKIIDGRFLVAKDTMWILEGKTIDLTWKNGKPESKALTTIFDKLVSARTQKVTANMVKNEWIAAAITAGIMKEATDGDGAAALKSLLGDTYEALTGAKGDAVITIKEEGLGKIKATSQGRQVEATVAEMAGKPAQ